MVQRNKSEKALYFAKKLTETEGIDLLDHVFGDNHQIYANPFTRTNFYHLRKDCVYIRNVSEDNLIVFENEEAAISGGRYIRRCRSCFDN
jgi:hypothetical protein